MCDMTILGKIWAILIANKFMGQYKAEVNMTNDLLLIVLKRGFIVE